MEGKHLFFDLDHTLWDFEKNSKSALKLLFKDLGLDKKIKDFSSFHGMYKNHNRVLWKQYGNGTISKEELRTKRFEDTLNYFRIDDKVLVESISQAYLEISPYQKNLFPFALETLENLQRENYQMHIITNGFKEVQHIKLREAGLLSFFDVIVCSEEIGVNKPNPLVFFHSMQRANALAKNSVMIGDDYVVDYLGALKAGMKSIFFNYQGEKKVRQDDDFIHQLNELPEKLTWIFRD